MQNKKYSFLVLIITSLALFSTCYTQYQLSPLGPQLMEQFQLSMSQFSSVFAAPMIPAILFSLIAGLFVDKFGIKKVISIALILATVGTCVRIISSDYMSLFICMILTGFGGAFINANGPKIIGSYFPVEKISSMMSILLAASTVAMALGMGTTGFFPTINLAFIFAAILTIISTFLWLVFIKGSQKSEAEALPAVSNSIAESLKVVVRSKFVWVVGFCLLGILACNVAISSFLPTALVGRGIDAITAGGYASIYLIGGLFGCIGSPIVVAKVGKMKPIMFILSMITAIGAAFAWNAPTGLFLGACLFVTGAAISGLMPLLMSIPIQLPEIGPEYAGTAGGFTATLQLLGAVIVPTYIITPIANSNMNLFFLLAGLCMVIVGALVLFLPELCKAVSSPDRQSELVIKPDPQ